MLLGCCSSNNNMQLEHSALNTDIQVNNNTLKSLPKIKIKGLLKHHLSKPCVKYCITICSYFYISVYLI